MDERLSEWLKTHGVSSEDSGAQDLVQMLKNGAVILPILDKLTRLGAGDKTMDWTNTSEFRVKPSRIADENWTEILTQLEKLEIAVTPEMQTGARSGDLDAITDILRAIQTKETVLSQASTPIQVPKGVYLDSLDTTKSLDQSNSCIEFLILSFCSSFRLAPKQAAGLLARNNQFLSRILVKGLKGDYDPVVVWYQSLYQTTGHLCDLMRRDQTSMDAVLMALKPGLESKAMEVVQWSFRTYTKLALDLEERGMSDRAWVWFAAQGLQTMLPCILKWGAVLYSNGIETLLHFAHPHLLEFFSLQLRDLMAETKAYFSFVMDLLPGIKETPWAVEAILECRVLQYWVEAANREANDPVSKCRVTAMVFLTYLWSEFLFNSPDSDSVFDTLLSTLKRAFHISSFLIKSTALCLLLSLLQTMVEAQSPQAAVIYKTLTLLMMETEPNESIRSLLTYSFRRILLEWPSIPLSILLEPLCKRVTSIQIQAAEGNFSLSMSDFDLFAAAAGHSRLGVKHAVLLIDVLGKVYLSDMVYSKAVMSSFCTIVTRFLDTEPMLAYLTAFLKFGISQVQTCEKSLKDKRYIKAQSSEYRAETAILRRKRDVVLEMTEWLVQLNNEELNEHIKNLFTTAVVEMRGNNQTDVKGFLMLLSEFGDPQIVISAYNKTKELEKTPEKHMIMDIIPKERRPFPWKRAFADIENAKRRSKDRQLRQFEAEESLKRRITAKQAELALQLDIRRVEQGLGKDAETAVYAEGVVTKLVGGEEETLFLREFTEEEKEEADAVRLVVKKYSRVFKVLFQKYAGTGFARKKEAAMAFDWLAERKNRMFDSEYIRLFLDLKVLPRLVTKEEVRSLLKSYCHKMARQTELNWVDYNGFVESFCQFAYFIYGREPQDLSYLPAVVAVKSLIDTMRSATQAAGHSTEVYDEPDPGTGDKDVVKQLTRLLLDDPNTPMPQGYKRVQDQDLTVSFTVPKVLDIPPAATAALEIIDKVMFDGLQIHFLEPRIEYFTVYRAKGVAPKKEKVVLPPIHERPASLLKRKIRSHVDDKPKETHPSAVHLSPVLKFQLAHCAGEDVSRVRECAELLEDMLHSLSLKMTRVIVREAAKHRKTASPDVQKEDKKEQKVKVVDTAMQIKRAQKQMEVLQQLQKAIAEKQRLKLDQEAAEKREKEKAQQRAQFLAAKKRKEMMEIQQLAKEKKTQQLEELRQKQESEQRLKLILDAKQRKAAKEFRKKAEERLTEVLEKKRREGLAKRPVTFASPNIRTEIAESQRRFERLALEDRKKQEQVERKKEEFRRFAESKDVESLLEQYKKPLEMVFSFYCKQSLTRLEQQPENLFNELKFSDFARFLCQFGVVPALIPSEVSLLTFNTLTRYKQRIAGLPATLTYPEFVTALLRITDEAKGKLNVLGGNKDGKGKEKQDGLTGRTLNALLVWMKLNLSQKEIGAKLKQLQGRRSSHRGGLSSSVDSLRDQDVTVDSSPVRSSQQELKRVKTKRSP